MPRFFISRNRPQARANQTADRGLIFDKGVDNRSHQLSLRNRESLEETLSSLGLRLGPSLIILALLLVAAGRLAIVS